VNSATSGLHLALEACGIGALDEVIIPTYTFTATAEVIRYLGAHPVFVDVDAETFNISPVAIREAITSKTKAIIPVHIAGLSCNMAEIIAIAKEFNLKIIEDAAHALPTTFEGTKVGLLDTDVTVFSFYANKAITTGEGGMVLTSDEHFKDKIKYFRNLAFAPPPGKRFIHEDLGWNYRLGSMQAALGNSQIARMDEIVEAKRVIGLKYHSVLSEHPLLEMQLTETSYALNMYWVVGVLLDDSINSEVLATALKSRGVDTRPFFFPLHQQPVLDKYGWADQMELSVSERLGKQGIYLPSYIGITDDDIDYVIEQLLISIDELK
jgi:perosamine synthetase